MSLLFDQNISFRVLKRISESFPSAVQVRAIGLEGATDRQIWKFAKKGGYTIVTFDADFTDLAGIYGTPPKIVWLRTGNMTTASIADLIIGRSEEIKHFLADEVSGILEIS